MQKFIAKSSELFDRFNPKYVAFKRRVANFRYPSVKLGSLLSESPEYGAGEAGIERVDEATPRSVQDRIASTASSIRAEARKLKTDAIAALESTKRKIEAGIVAANHSRGTREKGAILDKYLK